MPAIILFFSVFRIIPAGHVGVKVLFGEVDSTPLREGLNLVLNPLYDVVVMGWAGGEALGEARRGLAGVSKGEVGRPRFEMLGAMGLPSEDMLLAIRRDLATMSETMQRAAPARTQELSKPQPARPGSPSPSWSA